MYCIDVMFLSYFHNNSPWLLYIQYCLNVMKMTFEILNLLSDEIQFLLLRLKKNAFIIPCKKFNFIIQNFHFTTINSNFKVIDKMRICARIFFFSCRYASFQKTMQTRFLIWMYFRNKIFIIQANIRLGTLYEEVQYHTTSRRRNFYYVSTILWKIKIEKKSKEDSDVAVLLDISIHCCCSLSQPIVSKFLFDS